MIIIDCRYPADFICRGILPYNEVLKIIKTFHKGMFISN